MTDDDEFDRFWKEYPKRYGGNPKAKAKKAWNARRKGGAAAADIMSGLRRYTAFLEHTDRVGTEYVMQAATFLGPDERWQDEWEIEEDGRRNGNHGRSAGSQGRGKKAAGYDPAKDKYRHLYEG